MKTILVVEDERPLLEAIKIKLTNNSFEVLTARSVEQALDYVESTTTIDAIWLDHYLLGKESGLDFVADLKKRDGKFRQIPIFVVSNTAGPDKMQSYIELGVDKYYIKAEHRLEDIIAGIKSTLGVK